MKFRRGWAAPVVLSVALLATACGGGSDGDTAVDLDDEPTTAPEPTATSADASTGDEGTDEDGAGAEPTAAAEESAGTFEPGPAEFRALNLLDEPVDVYVRTTGLVQAFPITLGLAPGELTDFVAPPQDGNFLITTAGAGDPTCVATCDHFIARLSAFPEDGPVHTVLLYEDEFNGPSAYDLWEQPTPERLGETTNGMPPAQSLSAMAVIIAVALTDADFGLRLSTPDVDGCIEPFNLETILIGGNQTPAFLLDGPFTLHDNGDLECATPSDGPFPFSGEPGSRSFVFLTGSPGSIEATQLEMIMGEVVDSAPADDAASSDTAGGADRDTVVDLMADEVIFNFPVDAEQADCLAELIVDAIGTDILYADGALVDLDALPTEVNDLAGVALIESVTTCGIDPTVFDG